MIMPCTITKVCTFLNEYPSCFGDLQFLVLNAGCSFDCLCLR